MPAQQPQQMRMGIPMTQSSTTTTPITISIIAHFAIFLTTPAAASAENNELDSNGKFVWVGNIEIT